jgi:lipid II:glycine glycyltransferase (peptidoglycan interpeptide bridge formation enzyme)
MEIVEADNQEVWDEFLIKRERTSLLQSWAWGNFQISLGKKIKRFELRDHNKLEGVCLLIVESTKLGRFLYSPGGPVLTSNQLPATMKKALLDLAKAEGVDFMRVERPSPPVTQGLEDWRQTKAFRQPECTALLSLEKSEEELLSGLSDSTRYNIGWSKRKGVEIRMSDSVEKITEFERLLAETAARHRFVKQKEQSYYRKQFEAWVGSGLGKLLLAKKDDQVIAAALIVSFGDTTTYLHAASTTAVKLRQSYPMVWQAILEGKKAGSKYFDFWGVAPEGQKNHSWAGVTDFKMSFGATRITYPSSLEYPLGPKYYLHRLVEVGRPWVRGILR